MSEIKTKFEFIHFRELPQYSTHRRFSCRNTKSGELLGWVRWHVWKEKYVFMSTEGEAYEAEWLRDIAEFVDGVKDDG